MAEVKSTYLKDENGDVFSPIIGLNTLVDNNLNNNINQAQFQEDILNASEVVFVGFVSNVSSLKIQSFGYLQPNSVYFQEKAGEYNSSTGYVVKKAGWYEISTRFELPSINGASSSFETWLGCCIDNKPADSYRGLWKWQQYRNETSSTRIEHLNINQTVQIGYYFDGAATNTINSAQLTIKLLKEDSTEPATLNNSSVKGKYLKDKNTGSVISPIASAASCYLDHDNNLQNIIDRKTRLVSCISYDTINLPSAVNDTANITYFNSVSKISTSLSTNIGELITVSQTIPRVMVSRSGLYRIGVEARTADYTTGTQDGRVQIETTDINGTVTVHLMCGDRVTYRYGNAGSACLYLSRGTSICPRVWKDYSFNNLPCMSFYVEYLGPYGSNLEDYKLNPWTKTECDSYIKKLVDIYNKYKNNSQEKDKGYSFEEETDKYFKYATWVGSSAKTFYYFYKNGGLNILDPREY